MFILTSLLPEASFFFFFFKKNPPIMFVSHSNCLVTVLMGRLIIPYRFFGCQQGNSLSDYMTVYGSDSD